MKNLPRYPFLKKLSILIALFCFTVACLQDTETSKSNEPSSPQIIDAVDPILVISEGAVLPNTQPVYIESEYDLESAVYYDLISNHIQLSDAEKAMLEQNGFVVTDRLNWTRFVEAYAWIFKNDLPVVVTSDSILHAVHQSYSNVLQELELSVLKPELTRFLEGTLAQIEIDMRQVNDDELENLYQDVHDYLTIALILVRGEGLQDQDGKAYDSQRYGYKSMSGAPLSFEPSLLADYRSGQITNLVGQAIAADSATDISNSTGPTLDLFGTPRSIDFTLFQPRGHYTQAHELANYFRAMTWLGQADFRFVTFDLQTNEPKLHKGSVTAAKILQQAIDRAGERERLAEIDTILQFTIGQSDNTTLDHLDRLIQDMGWVEPADITATSDELILDQLLNNDYGQQRITGQLNGRSVDNSSDQSVPRPVTFILVGQRFSVDSWAMGNVVYDQLFYEGQPVERPLPTGFDVMAVLGNDHAISHLTSEFEQYPYEPTLATLRANVDGMDDAFWQSSVYNQWLSMIRGLNRDMTAENYPNVMRSEAWADKNLQTQLASWAQLRHDNILYVKQSYSNAQVACEFPAVYVEPYPELYQALFDFAQSGRALTMSQPIGSHIRNQLETYFENLSESATLLTTISEKELAGAELTVEEIGFLKGLVKKQAYFAGCGGASFEEMWDGWYMHMVYGGDESPALIADVHTNPTNDPASALYPSRVLHVGTGPAVAMLMIIETADGPTLHVGPAFSYYEFAEEGFPPVRLNDELWRKRLQSAVSYPQPPDWVSSFRVSVEKPSDPFEIPRHHETK